VGLLVALLLFVFIAFAIVGAVTLRDYHRAYARAHRDLPPIGVWAFHRDPDAGVEGARRTALFATAGSVAALALFGISLLSLPPA
jgi:hypothetical protein